jgi:hypothetical protein
MAATGFQPSPQARCSQCGEQLPESSKFCSICGARNINPLLPEQLYPQLSYSEHQFYSQQPYPNQPYAQPPHPLSGPYRPPSANPHHAVAHGFGSVFGLHPGIAVFVVAANLMLFGTTVLGGVIGQFLTAGLSWVAVLAICVIAGMLVGAVTYRGQLKWYGDDEESAKIKALIAAILTAIPSGLPGMLFGGVGFVTALFRRKA